MTESHRVAEAEVARLDGMAALGALVAAETALTGLEALAASEDPYLQAILFCGLAVTYAQAFEEVRGNHGLVRSFSVRQAPNVDRQLHRSLLTVRNEYVAHAGHQVNDYDLVFMTLKADFQGLTDEGVAFELSPTLFLGSIARASIAVGPLDAVGIDRIREHLKGVATHARVVLARNLALHLRRVFAKLKAEFVANPGGGPAGELLFTRDVQPSPSVHLAADDLRVSLAKSPEGLPLRFVTFSYQLADPSRDGPDNLVQGTGLAEASGAPPRYATLHPWQFPKMGLFFNMPRNAACPCGSGERYKRCCGAYEKPGE